MTPLLVPLRRATALLAIAALCIGAAQAGELYLFGDSLTDSGNNAIATHGGDPNQIITGNTYIPQLPYASGVYSNGNVWASRVADRLHERDAALPSLAGGDDFAFGGARAAADTDVPSTMTQLNMFLARGKKVHRDDVFIIAVGGNDVRDALLAASANPANAQLIIGTAAYNYAVAVGSMVDTLQAHGAHHILVWNTPDLGLVPAVRALGPQAAGTASLISGALNNALAARMANEQGVVIFDVSAVLQDIVAHKAAWGFVNVTDAAGAATGIDPDLWLFWDGIHPTAAGHRALARAVLAVWSQLDPDDEDDDDHDEDYRGHHDQYAYRR
jgi:outer membrane lipase/esterase